MKRRSFLRKSMIAIAGLPVIGTSMVALAKKAVQFVDPKSATAAKFNYVVDASKSKLRKDKPGAKAKDQNCTNCVFYMSKAKGDKSAPCPMLQMKHVPAEAWCDRWAFKKPK